MAILTICRESGARGEEIARMVAEILDAMERDPKTLPTRPPDPVKTPGS